MLARIVAREQTFLLSEKKRDKLIHRRESTRNTSALMTHLGVKCNTNRARSAADSAKGVLAAT